MSCGAVGCDGGAYGKSAQSNCAALSTDEHGLGGDGEDAIVLLMLLGAGYPTEGNGGYIGVFVVLLGGISGKGV